MRDPAMIAAGAIMALTLLTPTAFAQECKIAPNLWERASIFHPYGLHVQRLRKVLTAEILNASKNRITGL